MKLYPKQKEVHDEAFKILEKWSMVYLALPPRYGKTPISVSLSQGNTLFVTTKSAIPGIEKVISAMGKKDITISTYGSIHKHIDIYDTLVVDEAHSNISSFPKMSKSREKLDLIVEKNPKIKIIFLSGTPAIESSSKLYHQLSLSPRHSFSKYKSFYEWFNGSAQYADKTRSLPGYGILGLTKYTGSSRPSIDYSQTINFENKFKPIMITRSEEEKTVEVIPIYVDAPECIQTAIKDIGTKSIALYRDNVFVANNGASKQSKQHQFAGGTAINDKGEAIILNHFKAKLILQQHIGVNCCIFYKYIAERELLSNYFDEKDLYQIESNSTGVDMSHYDSAIIYSLTWSGSTYTQVLSRLVNVNRKDIPSIYIYLTKNSPDIKIFESVSRKLDYNNKFLAG